MTQSTCILHCVGAEVAYLAVPAVKPEHSNHVKPSCLCNSAACCPSYVQVSNKTGKHLTKAVTDVLRCRQQSVAVQLACVGHHATALTGRGSA